MLSNLNHDLTSYAFTQYKKETDDRAGVEYGSINYSEANVSYLKYLFAELYTLSSPELRVYL